MSGSDIHRAYEVLGLLPGASQEEIKQAYRQLVKIWHPDGFTDPAKKQLAEEKTKVINAAYRKLKSEALSSQVRVEYKTAENIYRSSQHKPPASSSRSYRPNVNAQPKASSAEKFYSWGVENVKLGKYEDAIGDFTQAIRINPFYIEAYKYRGLVCSQLGYELRATADLTKAAQLERHFRGKETKPPASPADYYRPMYRRYQSRSFGERICDTLKGWFNFRRR